MSHYNRTYEGLTGNARRAKALEDILEYLGTERFVQLHMAILSEGKVSLDQLRMWLSIPGIQGYPVKAWHELLYGEEDTMS